MSLVELAATAVVGALVACAMEPWSRFVHARFWHGPLHGVHRTHHPEPSVGARRRLEANDLFSLAHGVPAALALYLGFAVLSGPGAILATGLGFGLSAYGIAYILVHDGVVHGRLPVGFLKRWRFIRRVRAAHEVHHRHGGVPFGLFRGPQELRRARQGTRNSVE